MSSCKARQPRPRTRGIASVEFAITLPVLLLILMMIVEVGRLLAQYDTLTKSVRNGARYLAANSLLGTTGVVSITAAAQAATANLVVTGNVNGTGAKLLPGLAVANIAVANAGGGYVSVSASYPYQPLLGAVLPRFGYGPPTSFSFPLNSTVVMRAL